MSAAMCDADEPWWCWECHGMGSWYEDEQETDEPGEVECPCCSGNGNHEGDSAPACHPAANLPPPGTVRG